MSPAPSSAINLSIVSSGAAIDQGSVPEEGDISLVALKRLSLQAVPSGATLLSPMLTAVRISLLDSLQMDKVLTLTLQLSSE